MSIPAPAVCLDTSECAVLWETVSGQRRPPETIRSLEILTGGSPRLLAILARFGAGLSFRELMGNLLDLVDDHTEYFKSHLESLPAQERRVYLALADLWKPALTKEIADRARIETSKCSAQLARLIERGTVLVAGGSARRKQYYLSERLYNVYYLLRRRRRPDHLIEALIRFMASYYSPRELVDIGVRMAHEAEDLDPGMQSLYRSAFAQLMELPELIGHREELRTMASAGFAGIFNRISAPPEVAAARNLFNKAAALWEQNRAEDALAALEELVNRFGESEAPALLEPVARALVNKGMTLGGLDRPEEALSAYDEVVSRFGESETLALLEKVAAALVNKGTTLGRLDRPREALKAWDEIVNRFGESETPALLERVSTALFNKGATLGRLDRPGEALSAYDEVVSRFDESEATALLEPVATALVNKGTTLGRLDRPGEALSAYDEVVSRFGESETPALLEGVARALVYKGVTLGRLDRPEEALSAYDEVVSRFGESETPALLEGVARALVYKGGTLGKLDRPEEALSAYDEVVSRFGESETPALLEGVARALVYKGVTLGGLDRPEEELSAYDEVVSRFGESETPALLEGVARALVYKGATLGGLDRPEEELTAYDEVVSRFGGSKSTALRGWSEIALFAKAALELKSRRYEAAVETAGRVLDQPFTESLASRWQGHLIRARASLASGGPSSSEQDIEAMLTILPELGSLPSAGLDALMAFSIDLGPARMRELIQASPAADLLLPLTTALEREMGLEPRVAREIEEVAEDIRRDLAKRRDAGSDVGNV